MRRYLAPVIVPLMFALTACGSATGVTDSGASTQELESGYVETVTLRAGLSCDVFDTYSAGGVSCDWASFILPAEYEDATGSLDSLDAADGSIELSRYADGHMCVTYDGYESGGITCAYPSR